MQNGTKKIAQLGLFTATLLVASNMMGSGIFMLPVSLAQIGGITVYAWVITIIGVLALALTFAKLAVHYSEGAGPAYYAQQAFGEFAGYQMSWIYSIANWIALVSLLPIITGYLGYLIPAFQNIHVALITQIIVIWLMTWVNIKGTSFVGIFQSSTFLIAMVFIFIVIIFGWHYYHPAIFMAGWNPQHLSTSTAINHSFNNILWAFIGVESACVTAAAVKNAKRNVALATIFGVVIAAVVYVLACIVIMGIVPHDVLINSNAPFETTLDIMFHNNYITAGMAIVTVLKCLGATAGWMFLIGQAATAAAKDKLFPKIFAQNNNQGMPRNGLIILGVIYTVIVVVTISPHAQMQFQQIITISVILYLFPYIYGALAIIKLGKDKLPLKNYIFFSILGVVAALFCGWSIVSSNNTLALCGMLLLFIIPAFYGLRKNSPNP
ncbi:MAG: amino acid permease [Fusobacteria bacterium]|nr:amino acid permease [Fusobacteriota bacterium]